MARKAGDDAEFLTSRTLFGMTGLGAASGAAPLRERGWS